MLSNRDNINHHWYNHFLENEPYIILVKHRAYKMSEEINNNEIEKENNSKVDAIAAVAFSCIFVVTIIFWLSNQ